MQPSLVLGVVGDRATLAHSAIAATMQHPDEWRSYPYEWQWGPLAKIKFSDHTCAELLPKLEDDDFIEELGVWRGL